MDDQNTLHVFIGLGQSLMVGSQSLNDLVSVEPEFPDRVLMFQTIDHSDVRLGLDSGGSAEIRERTVLDPARLTGFTPLVAARAISGNRGETPMEAFANTITRQAEERGEFFRSLSFTAAFGGTRYSFLKKGTPVYANMLLALERAMELAAEEGWRVVVAGCLVKHGEGDIRNSAYLDNLIEWHSDVQADIQRITGQEEPVHFFMHQPSTHRGTNEPFSTIAMLESHKLSPVHHLAGADYPFASHYHADELHMTSPGYFLIGEQLARAWWQIHRLGLERTLITHMTSAERRGPEVQITYAVPVPPLVFDTVSIPERDVKGFTYLSGGEPLEIKEARITDDGLQTGVGRMVLTLASPPDEDVEEYVLYALQPQSPERSPENRVRGNVRDSAMDVSALDGRFLHNWAVHQRKGVTVYQSNP